MGHPNSGDDSDPGPLLDIYSTCPIGRGDDSTGFTRPFLDVARWTQAAGLRGLLVFTDNDSIDPWAAAQFIIERTTSLVPMVAVQPAYMHPYTAARKVSSLSSLYDRRIDLNLVTGGYRPHLRALGSVLEHGERYERLVEYGQIVAALLNGETPVAHRGTHYDLRNAVLNPPLPPGLRPRTFLAGSSPQAAAAATALGAVRLTYPHPPGQYAQDAPEALEAPEALSASDASGASGVPEVSGASDASELDGAGIRLGIIARQTSDAAWQIAHQRYPRNRLNEAYHQAAARTFDATWHEALWDSSQHPHDRRDPYWLYPFRVSREFCPYLVGSYAEVGAVLSRYLDLGVTTLILAQPRTEDDIFHALTAIRLAADEDRPVLNGSSMTG